MTKQIMLMYRQNELFKEYMPVIRKKLENLEYIVNEQIFETGTDRNKIDKWQSENIDLLSNKIVLTDRTCVGIYEVSENINIEIKEFAYLDNLFSRAAAQIVTPAYRAYDLDEQFHRNYEEGLKISQEIISSLVKEMLLVHTPNNIYVFLDHIYEHSPFDKIWYTFCNKNKSEEAEEFVIKYIKETFEKGGFPAQKVHVTYNAKDPFASLCEQNNWLITDRHFFKDIIVSGKHLILPIADFYRSGLKQGLIKLKGLEDELEKKLEQDF